jgi:hypothetical protein
MIDLRDLRRQVSRLDKDDVLKLFNVEERRSTLDYILPAAGVFGLGMLVGAGLGLLFAPRPGRELRSELRQRLSPEGQVPEGKITPAAWVAEHGSRTA